MNMGIKPLGERPRLNPVGAAFAAVSAIVFVALVFHAYTADKEDAAILSLALTHFADEAETKKAAPLSRANLALIESNAAEQPYRQDLLYLLYRDAAARGDSSKADRYATQMAKLGWRNTNAQRSLMIKAVTARDYVDLLNRADAMLRRDVLAGQALQLVFLFELNADVREPLVHALERRPPWRAAFFTQARTLQLPQSRLARLDTINHLLDARSKVSREEIAPLVNAFEVAREDRRAEALWVRFVKPGGRSPGYDPTFEKLARMDQDRTDLIMPFEWRLGQGTGSNTYVDSTGGIRVEWDGRGVPSFLRQRLRLKGKRPVTVAIALGSDVMTGAAALDLALICNGSGQIIPLENTDISADQDLITFSSSAPISCDLPELRISGALRDTASPVDFTIRSVEVTQP